MEKADFYSSISLPGSGFRIRIRIQPENPRLLSLSLSLTNSLEDLCEGPAVLALGELLEVGVVEGPGPVGQHLVDGGEAPELGRGPVEPLQPRLLPAHRQVQAARPLHQLLAPVPGAGLHTLGTFQFLTSVSDPDPGGSVFESPPGSRSRSVFDLRIRIQQEKSSCTVSNIHANFS